ncbi:MAG: hypothetical protein AAB270_07385 [Chloroflexota bacterium]
MAEPQTIYPVDDWIRATRTDGTVYQARFDFLVVGWSGGLQMERDEGVIRFAGLPTEISKATLVLAPVEYIFPQPGDETIVRADGQEIGRDRQTQPAPIQLDITPLVTGIGGELLVELAPTPVSGVRNWLRKYGSVRHAVQASRPRIVLEGAPVVNPPPGTPPPTTVPPPAPAPVGTEALGVLLPLLVMGMLAGVMGQVSEEMGAGLG